MWGKYNLPWTKRPLGIVRLQVPDKVVVFDLDETLGSFADLYILWTGIKHMFPSFSQFEKLLDLYPEFLRFGIYTVLEYLYEKRKERELTQLIIYTNNQCSKEWVQLIMRYFQKKIHAKQPKGTLPIPVFQMAICAFKIKNKQVEPHRTTNKKTYEDFLSCTDLPEGTPICFIDDAEHPDMHHRNVYYISPTRYVHPLKVSTIIKRCIETKWFFKGKKQVLLYSSEFWFQWFQSNGHKQEPVQDLQDILRSTTRLLFHLHLFVTKGATKGNRTPRKWKARKYTKKKHAYECYVCKV